MSKLKITSDTLAGFGLSEETNGNSSNYSELIEREGVPNTPFTIVKAEGKCFITWGPYKLTREVDDVEDCVKAIKEKSWELLTSLMTAIIMEVPNVHELLGASQKTKGLPAISPE